MYVLINDVKVGFKKSGTGSPILMVHGWGGSSDSLLELSKQFKDHSVYVIDLPGFGSSSDPPSNWGVFEYGELIRQFIDKLDLAGCVYVGHSFGGGLGIVLSAKYPGLFSGLVLLAPAYSREPQESSASKNLKKVVPMYDSIKKYLKFPRKIYYKIFYPRSDALKNPQLEESYRKIIATDLKEYVKDVSVPTLLLWGKRDQYTPEEDSGFLVKNIENIEYHSFKTYAHGFPLKYPTKIAPLIYEFLQKWR